MLRTQIYLPYSQVKAIKEKAKKEDISMSEVIRRELSASLEKETHNKKKFKNSGEWLEHVRKNVSFRGGSKDLAKNIDKYLYGEDAI